jgi:hypothetical protein
VTPAVVLPLPFAALAEALAADRALRQRFLKAAVRRLLAALQAQHGRHRGDRDVALAAWLADLASDLGIFEGNRVRFAEPTSQSDIAAALGVSREVLSTRLNDWERAGFLLTGGQTRRLEILDYARVALLAGMEGRPGRQALDEVLAEVDRAAAVAHLVRARNLCLDALRFFPSSPELHHRLGLSGLRIGGPQDALSGLRSAGFPLEDMDALREHVRRGLINPRLAPARLADLDAVEASLDEGEDWEDLAAEVDRRLPALLEDIAALAARAHKEAAFAAADPRPTLGRARAAYEAIHRAVGGTYAGINAAATAAMAGDGPTARNLARRLAARLSSAPAAGYWPLATLAEAQLILGEVEAAAEGFAAAAAAGDADDGTRATTRLQILRLAPALGVDPGPLLAALPARGAAVFAGPLFHAAVMPAAVQEAAEAALARPIADAFARHGIGHAYGALACGADIVFAEAALEAGIELHVVLPFAVEDFVRLSVAPGGARWEERARRCLREASSLSIAAPHAPADRDLDGHLRHGFRAAAAAALLKADALAGEALLIAAAGGKAPPGVAGTAAAIAEWTTLGRRVEVIALDVPRPAHPPRPRGASAFRPVVFLWPDGGAEEAARKLLTQVPPAGLVERASRDRRRGWGLVADSVPDALEAAGRVLAEAADAGLSVRVIADFGCILGAGLTLDPRALARLQGAADLPGFPAGRLLATTAFAMEARYEGAARVLAIGRNEATDRQRPSDGVFLLLP